MGTGSGSDGVVAPVQGGGSVARPVSIDVAHEDEEAVRRWVEGVLGWQPVDGATAALVPPTVRLVGPATRAYDDGVPRVLLLPAGTSARDAADAAVRTTARAVVAWPEERDLLDEVVVGVLGQGGTHRRGGRVLRIGGVAGGVGTTTVALAVAGLSGWAGTPTLATVRGDIPLPDVPTLAAGAVAAPDLWSRVPAPPGVAKVRVVRLDGSESPASPTDPSVGLAVFDQGVDVDVDVVVCRPDAAALDLLPTTTAAAVVVVGMGLVSKRDLVMAIAGRPTIRLPWSARVARAGLHRRVPASLPGAWIRLLTPLVSRPEG